jgi:hypothetical protein
MSRCGLASVLGVDSFLAETGTPGQRQPRSHWEGGGLGVQVGGEKIDLVILSLDKQQRSKLLSDRFTIGTSASASWENGKSAHEDPDAKILFFGHTDGVFAGFNLDGTTRKPDESGNKTLYGETTRNNEIVEGAVVPAVAQLLVSKLTSVVHTESASVSGLPGKPYLTQSLADKVCLVNTGQKSPSLRAGVFLVEGNRSFPIAPQTVNGRLRFRNCPDRHRVRGILYLRVGSGHWAEQKPGICTSPSAQLESNESLLK